MCPYIFGSKGPKFDPCIGKIVWRREWLPTPVFWPGEFHGQRSLAGYGQSGRTESDMTEPLTLALFSLWFHRPPLTPPGGSYCKRCLRNNPQGTLRRKHASLLTGPGGCMACVRVPNQVMGRRWVLVHPGALLLGSRMGCLGCHGLKSLLVNLKRECDLKCHTGK